VNVAGTTRTWSVINSPVIGFAMGLIYNRKWGKRFNE